MAQHIPLRFRGDLAHQVPVRQFAGNNRYGALTGCHPADHVGQPADFIPALDLYDLADIAGRNLTAPRN
jgi:hypothetical protein